MTKINLEQSEVEVREKRLGSITGFNGTAKELISYCQDGKPKECNRNFSQCTGCNASTAFCQLAMIRDIAVVNHAPVGCAGEFYNYNFIFRVGQKQRGVDNPIHGRYFNTNIQERDTVFGASDKLIETIREAYRRVNPKVIFVTTSCASGIIGEDVEQISQTLSEELGIPVIYCSCEGFRSRIWTTGFDAAYHSILRGIVKEPRKRVKRINVINFWGSHVFDKLFKRLGYELQYIIPFSKVEDLEYISEATATIQICSTLSTYLAAGLEQLYGVIEIKSPPAFGINGTDIWMREIGRVLDCGDEIEKIIQEQHEKVRPEIEKYREKFKGKKAYVTAGAAHGHALMALLKDLGFEVEGAAIFHHDPIYDNGDKTSDALAQMVEYHGDVKNYSVCNKQIYELVNSLNKSKADVIIARHMGMTTCAAKLGIPSLLVTDEQFIIGYEGILKFASRVFDALDKDEFIINYSKHCKLPYSKWWLEQNPFLFLGGNNHVENY